jgi:hypothetical protein
MSGLCVVAMLGLGAPAARATDIVIDAGSDGLAEGPVALAASGKLEPNHVYALVGQDLKIAAQTDAQGVLYWWSSGLPAGAKVRLGVQPGEATARVQLDKKGADLIEVQVDGKLFTALNFKKSEPRVYLYPVIGPTGAAVTRDYIMKDTPLESGNKRQDHPHHRSLWTAHGDIRVGNFDKTGYDFWAEPKGKPLPRQVLARVIRTVNGPVFGQVEAEIEWQTPEGKRLFTEDRTYTFYCGGRDERVIDQKNVFKFGDMDVMFADTKEGGLVSLRLAVTMDEIGVKQPAPLHGRMVNSRGGATAKECWGKAAEWCDYVGPLAGETVGVAVFDHPRNFRHPTTWHIRDYGLYTANPFGLAAFTNDKSKNGSHTWKKGETAEFNYRVLIHKGDTQASHVADQWKLYGAQPKISIE